MITTIFALSFLYLLVGIIIGQAWKTAWERRKRPVLAATFAAVGMVWPLIAPGFVLYALCVAANRTVVPAFWWLCGVVERLTARLVPTKP